MDTIELDALLIGGGVIVAVTALVLLRPAFGGDRKSDGLWSDGGGTEGIHLGGADSGGDGGSD